MKFFKITLFTILSIFCFHNINAQTDSHIAEKSKLLVETPTWATQITAEEHTHQGTTVRFMAIGHTLNGTPIFVDENGRVVIGSVDPCFREFEGNPYLLVYGSAFKPDDGFWIHSSDIRLKKNIKFLKDSREKFLKINFRSYDYRESGEHRVGIIAQEMKEFFPNSVSSYWEGGEEFLTFNPNNLFYTGMKVVQENSTDIIKQEEQIRTLQAENQRLKAELEAQKRRLDAIEALLANQEIEPTNPEAQPEPETAIRIQNARLEQNYPNPFPQFTTIPYYLPDDIQTATLIISDITGKEIAKHILPTQTGAGKIEVDIDDAQLRGGTFTYSLYINEALIDTKKMVLLSK